MRSLLIIPALAAASLSFGLGIGDIAPTLKVETVVKGKAVNLTKGLHVVEFWATWCGPCKMSIPHLTELSKKYDGKCDFTGVSVWENGTDQLGQVKKFVTDMGPKMDYNVDFDGDSKVMAKTWMMAAHQNGIPAAFLVKDGKILWIGHPMDGLDEAIGQVIDGKFNVTEAKAKFDEKAAAEAKAEAQQAKVMEVVKPLLVALRAKDYAAALTAAKGIDVNSANADMKPSLAQLFNSVAWSLIDPAHPSATPHYELAVVLAKDACDASNMKDPMSLDTYALALYDSGDKKQALTIQTQAVDMLKSTPGADAATVKDLQSRLDKYQKEAN